METARTSSTTRQQSPAGKGPAFRLCRRVAPALLGAALWYCALGLEAQAADWYVDNVVGKDSADGRAKSPGADNTGPFLSITQALRAAAAGDTVHLNPTGVLYRQMANFYDLKGGAEGKPLILDGHGATLSGAEPCTADGWTAAPDGVFTRRDLRSSVFLLVDGQMVWGTAPLQAMRPGEYRYGRDVFDRLHVRPPEGKKLSDCTVEVGQPDGSTVKLDPARWEQTHSPFKEVRRYPGLKAPTWVRIDGADAGAVTVADRLAPGAWCVENGTLFYRPPEGRELRSLVIECIVRENGIQMSGNTAYVVVRDLNVQHVSNDGFNIHGHVTHAEFYNCNARDCGDEGFSAHDTCETLLDGAVYDNCCNGIANVNSAGYSITRNVILARAREVGFLLQAGTQVWHELTDAILVDNPNQFSAGQVKATNVLVVNTARSGLKGPRALGCGSGAELKRVTAAGNGQALFIGPDATASLTDVLLGGGQGSFHVRMPEPFPTVTLVNVWSGPETKFECGSKYPWKTQPLNDWLTAATAAGRAERCGGRETPWSDALRNGQTPADLPPDIGCNAALIRKFCDWYATAAGK
jgi:hypothetical protein